MTVIQSVLISRRLSRREADSIIRRNGWCLTFRGKPVDVTDKYYHYRQHDVNSRKRHTTKQITRDIKFIFEV